MTAIERVRRTQRSLELVIGGSVLLWAAATLFGLLTIGAVIGGLVALPAVVRGLIPIVAAVAALTVFAVLAWRGRFVWSFDRVALWIEEHIPELRYALVTAIDPRYQGATAKLMEPAISRADPGRFVRAAAQRSTLPAALALLVTLGVFFAIPSDWVRKLNPVGIFGPLGGKPPVIGNRLKPLMGTVTPPAYAHMRTETLNNPAMISGLVGSQVVLTGYGSPDGIQATLTEVSSEEPISAPVGDSANDDSQQYEDAQAAAQQTSGDNGADQSGFGRGGGIPGMPGGGMSRQDESGARQSNPDDQGGLGGRPMGGGGIIGMNGLNGEQPGAARQETRQQKGPSSRKAKKPYVRPSVRQQARAAIVKSLKVTAGGKGWMVTMPLSDSNPALLRLVDRQYHQEIIINPQVDQPPTGRLILPARDTTIRMDTLKNVIPGNLSLSALFTDDVGLGSARFEYIKCSFGASAEDVVCVEGVLATKTLGGTKNGEFSYNVPLASLRFKEKKSKDDKEIIITSLKEGDQLSVRAVVTDNNTFSGPDTGFSETRTIRIAKRTEYQKINVNPSPPSADTALTTMRMLIMAVKDLEIQKVNMEHPLFMDSSMKLGGVAQQVKNKVDQIIDEQTGGGEVPVNSLLAFARDSMQDVVTDLLIGDTRASLPPLQASYDSLSKFNKAAKYFPPGLLTIDPVNIDRVRLKGTDSGATTPRTPRLMSDQDRQRYMRDYTMGVQQLRTSADDALHTLALLEVETLKKYPSLSQAVADVIAAVNAKKDPGTALQRARRILDGPAATLDTLPLWSGAW